MTELQHTPLHAAHLALNARMVDFGGWDMPVNYGSQIDEHKAVRTDAGMFDVSHMRVVDFNGPAARDFFKLAIANNVDKLTTPGKALYSCLLNSHGGVIDDLIVYYFAEDHFRVVVNAGTAEKDIAWFGQLNAEAEFDLDVHAAPRSGDRRRAGSERARKSLASAAGHARRHRIDQAVQRRAVPVDAVRRSNARAHRLHRRGRLRNRRAGRARRSVLERAESAGREAGRSRRTRHAAPRSRHEPLRPGHGRQRVAARCRARLDRRYEIVARFHRALRRWRRTARRRISSD